jgi:hypothetical protein
MLLILPSISLLSACHQLQVLRLNITTAAALAHAQSTHQLEDAHRAAETARLTAQADRMDSRWEAFVGQAWPETRERLAAQGKVRGVGMSVSVCTYV